MCWRQPNYCFGLVCFWLLEEKCVLARKQVGRALRAYERGAAREEPQNETEGGTVTAPGACRRARSGQWPRIEGWRLEKKSKSVLKSSQTCLWCVGHGLCWLGKLSCKHPTR